MIDIDKDTPLELVMHCYYKFLQYPQYLKLDLKQKFDRRNQDLKPVAPLACLRSDKSDDNFLKPRTYTCPSAKIVNQLKVEDYKVLVVKR